MIYMDSSQSLASSSQYINHIIIYIYIDYSAQDQLILSRFKHRQANSNWDCIHMWSFAIFLFQVLLLLKVIMWRSTNAQYIYNKNSQTSTRT